MCDLQFHEPNFINNIQFYNQSSLCSLSRNSLTKVRVSSGLLRALMIKIKQASKTTWRMTRAPTVKLLQVVFLSCAYVILLPYNDRSNPYLAGTLE